MIQLSQLRLCYVQYAPSTLELFLPGTADSPFKAPKLLQSFESSSSPSLQASARPRPLVTSSGGKAKQWHPEQQTLLAASSLPEAHGRSSMRRLRQERQQAGSSDDSILQRKRPEIRASGQIWNGYQIRLNPRTIRCASEQEPRVGRTTASLFRGLEVGCCWVVGR